MSSEQQSRSDGSCSQQLKGGCGRPKFSVVGLFYHSIECAKRYFCDFICAWNKFLLPLVKNALGKWKRNALKKASKKGC